MLLQKLFFYSNSLMSANKIYLVEFKKRRIVHSPKIDLIYDKHYKHVSISMCMCMYSRGENFHVLILFPSLRFSVFVPKGRNGIISRFGGRRGDGWFPIGIVFPHVLIGGNLGDGSFPCHFFRFLFLQ